MVRAGTTKLFPSGLFADSATEADAAEPLSSGPFVDSPDAKSQMAIRIQNGVFVRAACKAMRKRVRVEARRQRELEEGRPPEVLLESFLELLQHKLPSTRASEACPDFNCQGCKAPSCQGQEKE